MPPIQIGNVERPNAHILQSWIMGNEVDRAFVELVGPMPKQGLSSTSKFMRATGYAEATVLCCGLHPVLVTPQRWKRFHGLAKGAVKEDSRQLALKLAPELAPVLTRKKDHDRGEAALLALYGAAMLAQV